MRIILAVVVSALFTGCQLVPVEYVENQNRANVPVVDRNAREVSIELDTTASGLSARIMVDEPNMSNPNNKRMINIGPLPISGTFSIPQQRNAKIFITSSSKTVTPSPFSIDLPVSESSIKAVITAKDSLTDWQNEYKKLKPSTKSRIAKVVGLVDVARNTIVRDFNAKVAEAKSELLQLKVADSAATSTKIVKELENQIHYLESMERFYRSNLDIKSYVELLRDSQFLVQQIMGL